MVSNHAFNRLSVTIKCAKGDALQVAWGRVFILRMLFLGLYCVVAIRLFDLTVLQGSMVHNAPSVFDVSSVAGHLDARNNAGKKDSYKKDIVDRNGVLLATSLKTASLYADPKYILSAEASAQALHKIFPDLSYETLLARLQRSGRFVWLKRGIVPADQERVLMVGEPGLGFREEYKRIYPQGDMASHVVGYTNLDGQGLMGLERSFDSVLSEENSGANLIHSTMDIRFQHALRAELSAAKEEFKAQGASGIVMDAKNGDVLAMVSLPDFDPHAPMSSPDAARFNRASLGVYELGSVFKIFSTAAFLESQKNALSMEFDAREPLKRGRHLIRDFHPEKRVLTVPEVFMVSSNIGTALMGEMIGGEGLKRFYKSLGLLDKVETPFLEVGRPLYPRPWREINTLTASYGHGIAVSPLQLTSAVATVVNGGYKVTPRFLSVGDDSVNADTVSMRVVSKETSEVMRSLMRLVVTDGTAKNAAVTGVDVGGKTGTAEKPGKKGYDRKKLISSFVGAFPMSDPKYVVYVMLDEPKGNKETYGYATAGWTAAPAFQKIVSRIVSISGKDVDKKELQYKNQSVSNISYRGGE